MKPNSSYMINTMGQQHTWEIGSTNSYSPFFVDLYDDYNQSAYNSSLPNDVIQSVPIALVDSLGLFSNSRTSSKAALTNFTGIYYSTSQLNTFLNNY